LNLGCHGEKLETNCLNYGTGSKICKTRTVTNMMFVKKSRKEYTEGMPAFTTAILGPGLHRRKEVYPHISYEIQPSSE
jgi:hypothetical protein